MYIKRAAVIGAGTMGADIAYVIATAGIPVVVKDVSEAVLKKAQEHIADLFQTRVNRGRMTPEDAEKRQSYITFTTDNGDLREVSLVIEAVSEKMDLKKRVFQELDQVLPPLSLIVSNTSALSISELASVTGRPDRVAGFHFFFPAHMMKLIEVIAGRETSEETLETLRRFAEEIRKIPVTVKECPGFVVNRVLMASMAEVLRFQHETDIPFTDIDQVVTRAGLAPMGPFVLADALGLDVALEVARTLTNAYGERFEPGPQLEERVREGHLGLKSGQGFYSYR
ncbi:3-hydroxyacyl-CoA dehydrogenase family protein [Sulfobacillus harzensis]|uniref:3-hydroxybutyryl-CoA dehydrogenase n=1 Tax=Sulfobacillus harzensis TaxID=2729629 RepID=A0A7Y0Q4W0_9FIRM|nr:3-hydroxyacyl-CoA dehydrogenase family protein [Sulfobacillus harzensis]NMP23629.1 3-hydroxyacyl-CoA dehydrogenase family protein [Sulfobacillus harzensis]